MLKTSSRKVHFPALNPVLSISQDVVAAIVALMERSRAATESVLSYLASESTSEGGGLHILRPFLVECSAKDVRACFADVLFKTIR